MSNGQLHIVEDPRDRRVVVRAVAQHAKAELWAIEAIALKQLRADQRILEAQGLDALVDPDWPDDEESRLFLEATLGTPDDEAA